MNFKNNINFSLRLKILRQVGIQQKKYYKHLQLEQFLYTGEIPKITEDFNTKAFINCHDYDSYDEVINKIKEIDMNDKLYKQYILEPIGSIEKFPENPLKEYENYITYICRQDKMKACRRSNVFLGEYYQEELKNAFATKISVPSLKHQVVKKLKEFW